MAEAPSSEELVVDRPDRIVERRSEGQILGAIDLGTNSFHLLVARVDRDGQFDVLAKEKDVVRLGSGSGDMSELTEAAMDRGIATLTRFRQIADTFGAEVFAIATSALREAANRDEFLVRAQAEANVTIDVVSGVEEARLIHLGVLQSVPFFDQRMLVVDIGGGSTEFLVGEGTDVRIARSTKLGAIRLTDRFFPDGRVRSKAVRDAQKFVASFLVQTARDVGRHRPYIAVGSSGTILTIARIAAAMRGENPDNAMNGTSFSCAELDQVVETLTGYKTAAERVVIAGLDERRSDIIVAGAVLLQQIFAALDLDEMVVSEAALREGILLDRAAVSLVPTFHHLTNIRRQSVLRMAELFHEDLAHIERSTDLALSLFDQLAPLHARSITERDYLEAAGLLHNVGLFISHAAHHKHSYYVIRNSDQLSGFTDHEIEIIAQVARYHRKSAPKPSHHDFERLNDDDQRLVRLLAGVLRIGIALDRTRQGGVVELVVSGAGVDTRSNVGFPSSADHTETTVTIEVRCDDTHDLSLELYTAEQRTDLLARALGSDVLVHFVSETPVQ